MGLSLAPPYAKSGISRVWLGPQPMILVFAPETAEQVLSSNSLIDKAVFYNFIRSWLGQGLLTSTGSKWRSRRKMLTPSFHFRILEDFLPTINSETRTFVKVLEERRLGNNGIIDDISKPILMCALDVICGKSYLFSSKVLSFSSQFVFCCCCRYGNGSECRSAN